MQAGYSTRMGAAMRHAAHYLAAQKAEKKLLLVLTDGQPADVDVHDERLLIEDARKSVGELDQQGIFTYCISLDRKADDYVGDIFGRRYTVIDNIERSAGALPELFMALTPESLCVFCRPVSAVHPRRHAATAAMAGSGRHFLRHREQLATGLRLRGRRAPAMADQPAATAPDQPACGRIVHGCGYCPEHGEQSLSPCRYA
jgi:hypothetical protein